MGASRPSFAAGKVILLGEHAVVYDIPAIACGLNLGVEAVAAPIEAGMPSVLCYEGKEYRSDGEHVLSRALALLLGVLDAPATRIELQSGLPPGCGLGASAAQGVAIARAVLALLGRLDPQHRCTLAAATAWESFFHGTPSGVDTAAVISGGCIRYQRNHEVTHLTLEAPLKLVIAIAGPPASTKRMVEQVARIRAQKPRMVQAAFEEIEAIVMEAERFLRLGWLDKLGELLDRNHEWLRRIELSTREIEEALAIAKQAGALGGKLTGSGGGGAVVALIENDATPVLAALAASGFRAFEARVHGGIAKSEFIRTQSRVEGPLTEK
jgi:mevalonate kinase